jgi:serine/threonine protein kinase
MSTATPRRFPIEITREYTILTRLGGGGMGEVYLANDTNIDRLVAIKTLKVDLENESIEIASRLRQEAKTLGSLAHDNIVQIYRLITPNKYFPALVMEYVEGPTLGDIMKAEGRLSQLRIRQTLLPVAQALVEAHARNVIHRDLKPNNIMVRWDDQKTKLLDFSISRSDRGATISTGANQIVGTPNYMAPEQWNGGVIDARTDIYAMGVLLYEALAGHPPFKHPEIIPLMKMHLFDQPPPLTIEGAEELVDIVMWCLHKEPSERPPKMEVVVKALDRLLPTASYGSPQLALPKGCFEPGRGAAARAKGPDSSVRAITYDGEEFKIAPQDPTVIAGSAAEEETMASAKPVSGSQPRVTRRSGFSPTTPGAPTVVDSQIRDHPDAAGAFGASTRFDSPPELQKARRASRLPVLAVSGILLLAALAGGVVWAQARYKAKREFEATLDRSLLGPLSPYIALLGPAVPSVNSDLTRRDDGQMVDLFAGKRVYTARGASGNLQLAWRADEASDRITSLPGSRPRLRLELSFKPPVAAEAADLWLRPLRLVHKHGAKPPQELRKGDYLRVVTAARQPENVELDLVEFFQLDPSFLPEGLDEWHLELATLVTQSDGYSEREYRTDLMGSIPFQTIRVPIADAAPRPTPTPEPTPSPAPPTVTPTAVSTIVAAAISTPAPSPTPSPVPTPVFQRPTSVHYLVCSHPLSPELVCIIAVDEALNMDLTRVRWFQFWARRDVEVSLSRALRTDTAREALAAAIQIIRDNGGTFDTRTKQYQDGNKQFLQIFLPPSFQVLANTVNGQPTEFGFPIKGGWHPETGEYDPGRYTDTNGIQGLLTPRLMTRFDSVTYDPSLAATTQRLNLDERTTP